MGKTTIAWCDFTHNFHIGCTKVSPGCDHCYAETWAKRAGHPELWTGERRRTAPANWVKPHKWNREEGLDYLQGMRANRPRVFTDSLADFFDNQIPVPWRRDAWHVIDQTPNLDWLILTKRPQNIPKMLPEEGSGYTKPWGNGWPNVWFGTTAENQTEANRRIPLLRAVPAAKRFISVEPQLEYIEMWGMLDGIDWVICGGESGAHARIFDVDWARALLRECRAQGSAFFMKQLGCLPYSDGRPMHANPKGKYDDPAAWPDDLKVQEFPR